MKPALRFASLAIVAAAAAAATRDPLPVPAIPGHVTLKADLHMHTVFSDGDVWPTVRVMEAWRDGLDVISITDHNLYNPHEGDVSKDLARPYEIARGFAQSLGLILIPGIEVAEEDTHANALFVTDPNALKLPKFLDALRAARKQDAFVFWNHPGWKETPRWAGLIPPAYDEKLIQGIEIVNGPDFYPEAYPWLAEKRLTAIANSDLHGPSTAEYQPRTRPVTLIFARTADVDGVREALFAGRTAAWMNGQVWGNETELRQVWEAAVAAKIGPSSVKRGRRSGFQLRNRSAVPFRVRVAAQPSWLSMGVDDMKPEAITAFSFNVARDAPAGDQEVEVRFELTNIHTGPGRNLVVSMPLKLRVE